MCLSIFVVMSKMAELVRWQVGESTPEAMELPVGEERIYIWELQVGLCC